MACADAQRALRGAAPPPCRPHRPPAPPPLRLMLGSLAWRGAGLVSPSACQLHRLAVARCTLRMPSRRGAAGGAALSETARADGHCYLERVPGGSRVAPGGRRAVGPAAADFAGLFPRGCGSGPIRAGAPPQAGLPADVRAYARAVAPRHTHTQGHCTSKEQAPAPSQRPSSTSGRTWSTAVGPISLALTMQHSDGAKHRLRLFLLLAHCKAQSPELRERREATPNAI